MQSLNGSSRCWGTVKPAAYCKKLKHTQGEQKFQILVSNMEEIFNEHIRSCHFFFKGFKLLKTFQIGKDFKGWQTHSVKTEVKFLPQAVSSQKSRVKQN